MEMPKEVRRKLRIISSNQFGEPDDFYQTFTIKLIKQRL